jgi:hypothetical protein
MNTTNILPEHRRALIAVMNRLLAQRKKSTPAPASVPTPATVNTTGTK